MTTQEGGGGHEGHVDGRKNQWFEYDDMGNMVDLRARIISGEADGVQMRMRMQRRESLELRYDVGEGGGSRSWPFQHVVGVRK